MLPLVMLCMPMCVWSSGPVPLLEANEGWFLVNF